MNATYVFEGVAISLVDPREDVTHNQEEAKAYLDEVYKLHPSYKNTLQSVEITFDEADDTVSAHYVFKRKKFERIRRITGYLVGTTDRFNAAKQDELHDRVVHDSDFSLGQGILSEE